MIAGEGGLTQLALPLKFSEFEFRIARPAPGRGEHTEEILRGAGYRDAEIAALRGDGVI
jgi:crotonobetainyl-CoA:carnitine CoA-transferase CaiB-like acyl-CoA transferase